MNGASVLDWMRQIKLGAFCGLVLAGAVTSVEAAEPVAVEVGPFTFVTPETWTYQKPNSPMRKAEMKGPESEGQPGGEAVFFFFGPGQGGSASDNVARWLGQVADRTKEEVTSEEVGGVKVTFVHAEGTYASGMPGGPTTALPETTLLGAILESRSGNVFVRMTGGKKAMKAADESFRAMIRKAAETAR